MASKRYPLIIGISIPLVFFIITIICSFILGNYNHLNRMVSELGELGTKTQNIFTFGLVLCSFLSILFIIELYKICKKVGLNAIPVLLILSYSVSVLGAGIFPYPQRLHLLMGMPSILLFLSPLLGLILWKKGLPNIKLMSILCFLIMLLGFSTYWPDFMSNYIGLKQRFFHLGWSIWFIYLGYGFSHLLEKRV